MATPITPSRCWSISPMLAPSFCHRIWCFTKVDAGALDDCAADVAQSRIVQMRVLNCGASGKATLYGAGLGEECGISMTRLAMWNWAYVIHCAVLWWEKGDEMKNIGLAAVAILASLAVSSCSRQQTKDAADIVIRNARVYTVDKDRPSAQAVAVRGNRI